MAANQSLYGIPRPKTRAKEILTSSTLAFTNQLSSLLAQPSTSSSSSNTTTAARPRPSKIKPSIFNTHNKNTKKRALADIANGDDDGNATSTTAPSRKLKLSTRNPLSIVDSSTLQRSKRKLEEKARLYSSMKRGDYVPPAGSASAQVLDSNLLVDFDRKWAEAGRPTDFDSSDGEESDSQEANELVEYEDEFGRQRQGTRAEMRREERRRAAQAHATETLEELSARPAPPPQLIRGDVIQSAAFNPDAHLTAQMEEMARRRDRTLTPPPVSHYDANSEIRSKGVGFYAFSREEGERRKEMEALKRERRETERKRAEQGGGAGGVGEINEAKEAGRDEISGPADERGRNGSSDGAKSTNLANGLNIPNPIPISRPIPSCEPTIHPTMKQRHEEREEAEEEEEIDLADRFLNSLDDEGIRLDS